MADQPVASPDSTAGSEAAKTVDLGDVQPAGSRQLGRRSAVCATDDRVYAGLADGSVVAFDDDLREAWRNEAEDRGSVVSIAAFDDGVLVGERGVDGDVRLHDAETGAVRWCYTTADDVGSPQKETRFYLPFVVDLAVGDDCAFVASRRYERGQDGDRTFRSVVYAFERSGGVAWRYCTDASTISLDASGDRVAVGFNRCPGDHAAGFVVLDAESGDERRRWNPPGDGDRRVGDLSLVADGVVLASHADYRGYRIDEDGVRWSVDLGRPVERDGETVYSYPNHVHATENGALFVTGNTYPKDGRETDARHPNEHSAVGVGPGGERTFVSSIGGFAHEIAARDDRVAVPAAQHFRERDAERHGLRQFTLGDGQVAAFDADGVLTSASVTADWVVAVEEPVTYHDDGEERGAYRLHSYLG